MFHHLRLYRGMILFVITFKISKILMKHIVIKNSWDSKQQILYICSVGIFNIFKVIEQNVYPCSFGDGEWTRSRVTSGTRRSFLRLCLGDCRPRLRLRDRLLLFLRVLLFFILAVFLQISWFLEWFLMEHIDMKNSLVSKLQIYSLSSIGNPSRNWNIVENRCGIFPIPM